MRKLSQQTLLMLLLVLVTAIAGCQGESPTAPTSTTGGGSGSGGTPPPTGSTVVVTLSNANPLVLSTTQVTATVTVNGSPAPNGTGVEFSTDFGTFTDTNALTTIKTTTGGVASAILTATTAGTAIVTVRVNNVNQRVTVVFKNSDPVPPGPPSFSVTSISPATGRPSGGEIVVIKGVAFKAPVRVLFGTKEAVVISFTSTEIRVITPPINLGGTTQFQDVDITVFNQAGTTSEAQITKPKVFRYQVEILTPLVYTVSPASGPNEGNTRVTIFGEGFQAPTRVFFGTASSTGGLPGQVELEVISVNFSQIIAVTPPATGLGLSLRNLQVALRVLNVGTNKESVLPLAFRYGPTMQITAVGPTQGDVAGGTQVTIDGQGFDDPVAVTLAGIAAIPIRVSGTQIVVISGTPIIAGCAGPSPGPVSVTNIENGETQTGGTFTYTIVKPVITGINPQPVAAGGMLTVTISGNISGNVQFQVSTKTVFATQVSPGVFQFVVPSNLVFLTAPCVDMVTGTAGTMNIPTSFPLTFTDPATGCTQTLAEAVTVTPSDVNCKTTPVPPAAAVAAALPPDQPFGSTTVGTPVNRAQKICNTGPAASTLTVNGPGSISGADAGQFGPNPPGPPATTMVTGGNCTASFNLTFTPTSVGAKTATYSVNTSAGIVNVALTGTGN
ncbi:MAG TPA: IPT/TIG domain-containing protein [Thermoanaerobaculia bacterium]|nr:IPT/TIG domain-containing protein [Thermoanaerobaculia bacterium]